MAGFTIERELPYDAIIRKVEALCEGRISDVALMANISSLLYWSLEDINWVGFYLRSGDTLHLGPFHGKTACVSIPVGKGVCGTAAQECRTIFVDDVEQFPGHIACDDASRSELVVPLMDNGTCIGVLDTDSPVLRRFTDNERRLFEEVARTFMCARLKTLTAYRWQMA